MSAVEITLNGDPREVSEGLTVSGLLAELGIQETRVAVERNREIVPRARFAEVRVEPGDEIEVVWFVGGGACA